MSDGETTYTYAESAFWPIPVQVGNPITFQGEVVGEVTAIEEGETVRLSIEREAALRMGLVQPGGFSIGTYEVIE